MPLEEEIIVYKPNNKWVSAVYPQINDKILDDYPRPNAADLQ